MADFDNTNRGALFHQDEKTSDKAPDLKGKLNVEGKDYDIAAWNKESKAGKPYLSISIQEPWSKNDSDEDTTDEPTAERSDERRPY